MSEAELFELVAIYVSNCISAFTVYLSLVFGYLTVAYLIAPRLTRYQAIVATTIYLMGAISCVLTLLHSLSVLIGIENQLQLASEIYNDVIFGNSGIWLISMALITSSGLIGSVMFFYNVRTLFHNRLLLS